PGGPNSSTPKEYIINTKCQFPRMHYREWLPFAGARSPVKSSGRNDGNITISLRACLAKDSPATQNYVVNILLLLYMFFIYLLNNLPISSHVTGWPSTNISFKIIFPSLGSTFFNADILFLVSDIALYSVMIAT